jgi:hypothetical protein
MTYESNQYLGIEPISMVLIPLAITGTGKLVSWISGKQIEKQTESDIAKIEAQYEAKRTRDDIIYSTQTVSDSQKSFYENLEKQEKEKTLRNIIIGSTVAVGGFLLLNK